MSAPTADPAAIDLAGLKADPRTPWTWDDLLALPESPWRCEIVDGTLLMSPPPAFRHDAVAALVRESLALTVGPARIALGPLGVAVGPSYLIPDLAVIDRQVLDAEKGRLDAQDVHLVVEVVSPSSTTTDRVTKPAQYAAHGVGAYWRVETEGGVAITAYTLREGDEVYTELGTWREGETLHVAEPFEMSIDVSACAP